MGKNTLRFQHWYQMEIGFDGGVLECSRNGGAWFDLIEAEGATVTGGYDRPIRTNYGSAIAGQMAWSSQTGGFVETTVDFPAAWADEGLRLRWRLVHDQSSSKDGWWIDDIEVSSEVEDCENHRPVLSLELQGGDLNENFPDQEVSVSLTSDLPLLEDVAVVLGLGGTASANDFEGELEVVLPGGESRVAITIMASQDDLSEGEETLSLSIPDDRLGFAAGGNASETITIVDRAGILEWAAGFYSGSVDLTGDTDGDGLSLLEEYLLGTDPTSVFSRAQVELVSQGGSFLIPVGELPERADATLGVEFSDDLVSWAAGELTKTGEGIVVVPPGEAGFYRLTFALEQ